MKTVKVLTLSLGIFFLFTLLSSLFFSLTFFLHFRDRIYPGILIAHQPVSGLTPLEAENLLKQKLRLPPSLLLVFTYDGKTWYESPPTLGIEPESKYLAKAAYAIGRRPNPYLSFKEIWQASFKTRTIAPSYEINNNKLDRFLDTLHTTIDIASRDAQFQFKAGAGPDSKGRVVAFVQSKEGRTIDDQRLEEQLKDQLEQRAGSQSREPSLLQMAIPTKTVPPKVSSDQANRLGIVESLGVGESYFTDSIPSRIYNIKLSSEKISGSLIAPGEIFSFNDAIGTISAVFGFKQAYVIVNNKTVLGDGGGVCQTTTTLYRTVLNAGLPVTERTAHAYRVGFYEQGGFLPGLDATVYPPSPDFKFKNDTGNWLLLQATIDETTAKLTLELFGKSDGRKTVLKGPVIVSTIAPPAPIYEDDPTISMGQVKQVDTAHAGATVHFERQVTRDNQVIINETVASSYIPWPARFLRGTKTN